MSTMNYNGVEYTKVFIDPTALENGNGTTPTTAYNNFPSQLTDNTVYIVRRDNTKFASLPLINMYANRIMILGMPRPIDFMYQYMGSEEKTTWTENFDYALVRCNTTVNETPQVYFKNIIDFSLFGCYFFRDSESNNNVNANNYMFMMNSPDRANTTIDNCKFGFWGDNLDNDAWLANNSSLSSRNMYGQFINCRDNRSISISNCVFNFTKLRIGENRFDSLTTQSSCIEADYIRMISIRDNQFNIVAKDEDASSAILSSVSCIRNDYCNISIFKNNTFNLIDYSTFSVPTSNLIYCHTRSNVSAKTIFYNNKVQYKQMLDNTPKFSSSVASLFHFEGLVDYEINYFNFDFSNSPYQGFHEVLKVNTSISRSVENNISNINIQFNQNGSVNCTTNDRYLLYYYTNKRASGDFNDYCPVPIHSICKAYNIDIERWDGGSSVYLEGVCLEATVIRGYSRLNGFSYLKVDNYYNNRGDNSAIYLNQYDNTLQIDNLIVNKENYLYPYNPAIKQIDITTESDRRYSNQIFINHCNSLPFDTTLANTANQQTGLIAWVANDYNGLFLERNSSASAKSWGVLRNGSKAKASLKLETTVDSSYNDLILGNKPCTGFLLKPNATGNKTITVYFSCSNSYSDFNSLASKIWVEAYVKQDENTNEKIIYDSLTLGSISSDSSSWVGDSGVTSYKITLPVEIKTMEDVEVKVHFKWYDTIGYTYLDPELHLD